MQDEYVDDLIELGLTNLQAKVYLILGQLGESKAAEICKLSKVTRPDIYRILDELYDLGLIEKTLTKPLLFKATPLRIGINLLLERKEKKTFDLKNKLEKIVCSLEKHKTENNPMKDYKFVKIPNKGSIIKEDIELNRIDWQTMDIVTLSSRFTRWFNDNKRTINEVLDKGVRMRIIIIHHQDLQSLRKQCLPYSDNLCKNPLAQVKYISTDAPALICLYDNKAMRLVLEPSQYECGGAGPDLYSDHPGLVGMARMYFESLWNTA